MNVITNLLFPFVLISGMVCTCATRCLAQWIPLTAKTSETRTITRSNGSQSHITLEGSLYRSTRGDQFEHFKIVQDGKLVEESASLLDNEKLRIYKINYITKTVQEVKKLDGRRLPTEMSSSSLQLPQETIDGRKCSIFPVVLKGQTVGKMWKSRELDIPLKSEYTVTEGGSSMHIQARIFDIQTGHEPEKGLFSPDPTFRVLPPLIH